MKNLNGIRARDMPRLSQAAASRRGGHLDMAMVAVARDAMLRVREIPRVTWQDVSYLPDGSAVLTVSGDIFLLREPFHKPKLGACGSRRYYQPQVQSPDWIYFPSQVVGDISRDHAHPRCSRE